MVGHGASHTGIVHANMTLTPSNVRVTELLKFQKLPKTALGLTFISALPAARSLLSQVGRNKPCTLAAMTVSPLSALSGFIMSVIYTYSAIQTKLCTRKLGFLAEAFLIVLVKNFSSQSAFTSYWGTVQATFGTYC